MLDRLFPRPLTLAIGNRELQFSSVAEFDFAMSGRTEVPTHKLAELLRLAPDELRREARQIKATEKQFVKAMTEALDRPDEIRAFLQRIDPKVFSHDHGWRDIMAALRDQPPEYDELRRVALVKYVQYLSARQDLLRHAWRLKRDAGRLPAAPASAEEPAGPMRETVILDVPPPTPAPRDDALERLPKGEAVTLPLTPGERVALHLSRHRFILVAARPPLLVEHSGRAHPLAEGKNLVGRDPICDVAVDPSLRDISRLHLVVDTAALPAVTLTDLSSHGTRLPGAVLARAAPAPDIPEEN